MDNPVSYTLNSQPTGNKNKTSMIVIIIVLLIAALVGGYFFMQQNKKPDETKTVVEEKNTPTSTPSPTPKPIDKESINIQVLNGTGTPGEAKKAVDALVEAGYKAENITTGNAEEYDHTKVTISAKKGFEAAAKDIQKSLDAAFESIEIDTDELSATSDYDVVVTTGGKIFEEPTSGPTAKPTIPQISLTTAASTSITPTTSPTPTP